MKLLQNPILLFQKTNFKVFGEGFQKIGCSLVKKEKPPEHLSEFQGFKNCILTMI
jgi:hypothetical protein